MTTEDNASKADDPSIMEAGVNDRIAMPAGTEPQCPIAQGESDLKLSYCDCSKLRSKFFLLLCNLGVCAVVVLTAFLLWYLKVFPFTAIPKVLYVDGQVKEDEESKGCSSLRLPLCHKYKTPYTYTVYPNALGYQSQTDASEALVRYEPLVSVKCYPLLPLFLCTLYAPKCMDEGRLVPPCKSLCKETIRRCDFFLGVFSVSWPEDLDCDLLPDSPDPDICVGHEQIKSLETAARACINGFRCDRTRCLPKSWKCDGFSDCTDGADERNCSNCGPDQFYCGGGTCIDKGLVCDGIRDCPDGREERRCLRLSGNQGHRGEGRLEAYSLISDSWQPVCGDQWDTDTMSPRACAMLGYKSVKETRLRDEAFAAESRLAIGTALEVKTKMKSLFSRSQMWKVCRSSWWHERKGSIPNRWRHRI